MNDDLLTPIRTLIFDLDGTLVDSSESILSCFSRALAAHEIAPQIPLTAAIIGPPLKTTLSSLADTQDEQLLGKLAASFMAHYDGEGYKATRVYPGVAEMLEQSFAEGIKLHLATNKRLHPTQRILEHLGWSAWFASVYALDVAVPAFANKAAMLSHLLSEQSIATGKAAYVGDRPEDGQAADSNGLAFFAANWGYGRFPEDIPGHWQVIEAPGSLRQFAA